MKTITLQDATNLLKMTPEGLRRKAIARKIPAIKPGKCWLFIEDDLVDYMRSFILGQLIYRRVSLNL